MNVPSRGMANAGLFDSPAARIALCGAAAMALVAAPYVVYPVFLMNALCFARCASAFNLLIGYVGLLSFGHAAFFGFSAYVTAYTLKAWHVPTEVGLLAGVAAAAAMGLVIGALAIRRQGIYFAMITLALAQMVYFFSLQAPAFTGGENGIQAVPNPPLFGVIDLENDTSMYFVVVGVFLLGFGLIYRAIHSPFGQVLKAIRENEPRAISLGYHIDRYKLLAFVLSASLAGLAGSTKVLVQHAAALSDIQWQQSGEVVLMTLVGGMGTILGPVVGAFVIVAMQQYLQVGEWVLRRACEDIRTWHAQGLPRVPVAVNLAARQFRQSDLHARILRIVRAARVEPSLIELEITESQLMQDPDHAITMLRSLSDGGVASG